MAANRYKHDDLLVKADQAIVRPDIRRLRVSPVARIIHLKRDMLDGFLTRHSLPSLYATALGSDDGFRPTSLPSKRCSISSSRNFDSILGLEERYARRCNPS